MNPEKIKAEEFLQLSANIPVCDVRSESEFAAGHIPGAINLPIFSDKEREAVGIKYKKQGSIEAIKLGLDIAGPAMSEKLERGLALSVSNQILIHCWRGGMRSEAMAWVFSLAGLKVKVLDGGYKAYRHLVLESLAAKKKMLILGGLTGSGKTHILNYLKNIGHQVIDMEGLANHKGSAFGSLGQKPQPSTEHFANMLFDEWKSKDPERLVWLEDESRNIGSVFLPEEYYSNMQEAPAIVLMMDIKTRMPRLLEEYSEFPEDSLINGIQRISKRLGGDNTKEAISAIRSGDIAKAIEITLAYYDKAYMYGLKRKTPSKVILIKTDTDNIIENASKVLEASGKISL